MTFEWKLRKELLEATHMWPIIFLSIIIGALIGWAISYIFPTNFRGETILHVSYNADVYYRNPDDYKNWQMEELNGLVLSEQVLQDTVGRASTKSSQFEINGVEELFDRFDVYWRNVGSWHLVVKAETPEKASLLSKEWEVVVIEEIDLALSHAKTMLDLDFQIKEVTKQLVEIDKQVEEISLLVDFLNVWLETVKSRDDNQIVVLSERWRLYSAVARAARLDSAGHKLIDQIPEENATIGDYKAWVERSLDYMDNIKTTLDTQSKTLSDRQKELSQLWAEEQPLSRGLSAYLSVDSVDKEDYEITPVRPTSQLALIGGVLGLLVWGIAWIARPFLMAKR